MKKKVLLPMLAVASVFALASCSDEAPANVVYTDASGSEVKTEITKTDDKDEVVKAVNAMTESSKNNKLNVTSAAVKINGDVNLEAAMGMSKLSLNLSASAEANLGVEGAGEAAVLYSYVKGSVNGNFKTEVDKDAFNSAASAAGGLLGSIGVSIPEVSGDLGTEQKIDGNAEAYYATSDDKIYLSTNELKGFITVDNSDVELPDVDFSGYEDSTKYVELLSSLISSNEANVTISYTTKDTVEFTIKFNPSASVNENQMVAEALANAEFKVTFNTTYFLPVKASVDLGAAAKAALEENKCTVSSARIYLEATIDYNNGVKKLSDSDKSGYTKDITSDVEAAVEGIINSIGSYIPEEL